jgi:hypothetical protein
MSCEAQHQEIHSNLLLRQHIALLLVLKENTICHGCAALLAGKLITGDGSNAANRFSNLAAEALLSEVQKQS